MAADDFFARWAKKKKDVAAVGNDAELVATRAEISGISPAENVNQGEIAEVVAKPLPTHEDVAGLTDDSDFSAFMAQGVDENVKRSAMKKLFSNPHFNVMDGLDVYIEDFNNFEPMTPEILASLNHAKALLDPLSQFNFPLMELSEPPEENEEAQPDEVEQAEDQIDLHEETSIIVEQEKKEYAEEREPQALKESDNKPGADKT